MPADMQKRDAAGGLMGYAKAKSTKSLGAGLSSSVILAICAYQLSSPAASSAAIVACGKQALGHPS